MMIAEININGIINSLTELKTYAKLTDEIPTD